MNTACRQPQEINSPSWLVGQVLYMKKQLSGGSACEAAVLWQRPLLFFGFYAQCVARPTRDVNTHHLTERWLCERNGLIDPCTQNVNKYMIGMIEDVTGHCHSGRLVAWPVALIVGLTHHAWLCSRRTYDLLLEFMIAWACSLACSSWWFEAVRYNKFSTNTRMHVRMLSDDQSRMHDSCHISRSAHTLGWNRIDRNTSCKMTSCCLIKLFYERLILESLWVCTPKASQQTKSSSL